MHCVVCLLALRSLRCRRCAVCRRRQCRRKLLQQGASDSDRQPESPLPGQQPGNSSGGDNYAPFAPPQPDMGSGIGNVGNGTSGSGTSSDGNATGGSTTADQACCCRYQNNPFPYSQTSTWAPTAAAAARNVSVGCGGGLSLLCRHMLF